MYGKVIDQSDPMIMYSTGIGRVIRVSERGKEKRRFDIVLFTSRGRCCLLCRQTFGPLLIAGYTTQVKLSTFASPKDQQGETCDPQMFQPCTLSTHPKRLATSNPCDTREFPSLNHEDQRLDLGKIKAMMYCASSYLAEASGTPERQTKLKPHGPESPEDPALSPINHMRLVVRYPAICW